MAGRAGLVAKKKTVTRGTKSHQQTFWVKSDADHAKEVRGQTRVPAGSQFTPEARERLHAMGIRKMPAADVKPSSITVNTTGNIHRHAVITWRDSAGRVQSAYTPEFHAANAAKKWAKVTKLRPRLESAIQELQSNAATSDAHAAGLIIAQTGLRVGSQKSVAAHQHYGVTTMERRHVTINHDGTATIRYIGKAGKENVATVTDPHAVAALRDRVRGKGPNDRVFDASSAHVRAAVPAGFRPKDFRTIVATQTAERALAEFHPPPPLTGNARTDARNVARAIQHASTVTSTAINNTPAVARASYIHPQVFAQWARSVGLPSSVLEGGS